MGGDFSICESFAGVHDTNIVNEFPVCYNPFLFNPVESGGQECQLDLIRVRSQGDFDANN